MFTRRHLLPVTGFCYTWLMIGFFTGTAVLVGPARWLTDAIHARGGSQQAEDLAMIALIVVYVLASALLSWVVFRYLARCHTRRMRIGIPALLTMAAAVCLWAWLDPARLSGMAGSKVTVLEMSSGAEFVFGPYPAPDRLQELKNEGFTAVISLQHPDVVPFEPQGIADESAAAKRLGIRFINAPMLPWISSNDTSLEKIREIARTGKGKYYIHCGLGRDRVNIVKRMLELQGTRVADDKNLVAPLRFEDRLASNEPMERGRITQLDSQVWLIPFPNEDELPGYMLSGQAAHVTLLLDPADPEQNKWIDTAEKLLSEFKVPHVLKLLHPGDAIAAREIVKAVKSAPRPEVVVVPTTSPEPSAEVAATLIKAFGAPGS